jgi:alkylation response protein AidB-like acyl-CoA dehydrogenase
MTPVAEAPARTDWVAVARAIGERFRTTAPARERAGTPPREDLAAVREARLVNLMIPRDLGGEGGSWVDASRVVSELSTTDPSLGALLSYHYVNFIPDLLDYETGGEQIRRLSAENRWLWSNVTQPWVPFTADPTPDGGFILNGVKPLNSGTAVADVNTVLAPRSDRPEFIYVYLPRDREGITYHDDWDAFGLRRSETVTMTFTDVVVRPDEVLTDTHPGPRVSFPPFYLAPGGLSFASILVGAARGALEIAREHVAGDPDAHDPEVLSAFGELSARVQAAVALRERVAAQIADGYERRRELTSAELSELGLAAERLRIFAAEVGLRVGSEVFELVGPGALGDAVGLDRFWRDVRIHSLHVNPLIYSRRVLGELFLGEREFSGPPFIVPGPSEVSQ